MSVGLQRLREDAATIRAGASKKGEDPTLVDRALELDEERRRLLGDVDGMRAERKQLSAEVGAAMKAGGSGADALMAQSVELGTRIEAGRVFADGGRVLNVTASGPTLAEARARAYAAIDLIDWPGGFCRRDIGWRVLGHDDDAPRS